MANPFDQFDAPTEANPFDAFDVKPPVKGGLVASAKQAIGSTIKGAGQAAADFLPGVGQDNALKTYGRSVVDANPTAVHSLADLKANPLTGVAEATGNAGGSMGAMLGARALGTGITAAAPFTGPAAPLVAGIGQGIAWLGPMAAAALPSFGGIREQQIKDDPNRQDSIGAKALAAAGAGTVGLIESKFGPQEWALSAMSKEGRGQLAEKFAAKTLGGSVAKGAAKGAAIEGAEEIAQNPIEQIASYQNPLTADNLKDTAFSGVMGALGGGVLGGASGAAFRKGAENKPAATPEVAPVAPAINPADSALMQQQLLAEQEAAAMGIDAANGPISAAASLALKSGAAQTPAQIAMQAERQRLAEAALQQDAADTEVADATGIDAQQQNTDWNRFRAQEEQALKDERDKARFETERKRAETRGEMRDAAQQMIAEGSYEADQRKAAQEARQAEDPGLPFERIAPEDFDTLNPIKVGQGELVDPVEPERKGLSAPRQQRALPNQGGNPALGFTPKSADPMRATADGQVGTAQQFDELAKTKQTRKEQMRSAVERARDLINQGATLKGRNLVDASNNVVLPNLNIQQYREANTLLKSKPNAQAAETPAPSVPVQAAPQGSQQQSAGVENPVIKESLTTETPATIKPDLTVQAPATGKQSLQVQPENSNGNARPASETVHPVSPAQGGVNAGGVGNLRADRGSGTGGQAVRNDAAEPVASVPDSRAGGSSERVRQTNLITLVRQAGGVSLESKADVTGDKNSRETLGVFRKSGMSLDRLAEVLQQNGYITESEVSDVTSGAEKASELLRDALAGNRPLNMADNERAMSDAEEAKQRDAIRKKADELGIKWRFRKTEDVEAEINQREEVAPEDRSAYDYSSESENVQDFSDEFDIFNDATPLTGKAAMRVAGFTEEEINEAIQSESRQGKAGGTEPAGTQSRRADSGSQAGSGEQGGILESYTEKDLAARDEAQRLKAEEKARADKAADDKARADSERDSFTLTGSDRSADRAAAQGQGDIFDSSPTQKESPASVSTESNPASAKSSANQNPIKAETRASTGPEAESASANQETVKPSPALESLFADLDSSTVRKANKAKKAAKLHPQAAEINYVQNNYHDILIQLMDAGKLEVNGSKSVTEENKSCL